MQKIWRRKDRLTDRHIQTSNDWSV